MDNGNNNQNKNTKVKEVDYKALISKIICLETELKQKKEAITENEQVNDLPKLEKKLKNEKSNLFHSLVDADSQSFLDFAEAVLFAYENDKDNRRLIKGLLTDEQVSKRASTLCRIDYNGYYDVLCKIDGQMFLDDYPMYTLRPEASLYGCELHKAKNSKDYILPIKSEEILNRIQLFSDKNDYEHLAEWIIAIMSFDADSVISNSNKEKIIEERQQLLLDLIGKIKNDFNYQKALNDKLFVQGTLAKILFESVKNAKNASRFKVESEKAKEDLRNNQKYIQEQKENEQNRTENFTKEIELLKEKAKNYSLMQNKLDDIINRYNAQTSINELLVMETKKAIEQRDVEVQKLKEENAKLKETCENLSHDLENVNSDLILRNNELDRIKSESDLIGKRAKNSILQSLTTGLKEYIYYLALYHYELSTNGEMDKDTIDMFGSTIKSIEGALEELGIEKYGELDEFTSFDSSLHESVGDKMQNGDKVVFRSFGWKIDGEVYAKAQVEGAE